LEGTPPGKLHQYQNKGVAGEVVRMCMKINNLNETVVPHTPVRAGHPQSSN
jgi:hypothetical protein